MTTLSFPLAPAEPFAWPGGYPIGYLVDDGEFLCAWCVNNPTNPVHFGDEADGWRIEGLDVLDGSALDYDGPISCAHCNRLLVEVDDGDDYTARRSNVARPIGGGCFPR